VISRQFGVEENAGSGSCFPVCLCIQIALVAALAVSCSQSAPAPLVLTAFDEAFAAARPVLAEGIALIRPAGYQLRSIPVSLGEGPAKVLSELEGLASAGNSPAALVASPMVASFLQGAIADERFGKMLLIAPEWRSTERKADKVVLNDPVPAFEKAGKVSGTFIGQLRKASGSLTSAGILFMETASRPRAALRAFSSAYAAASDNAPLQVREISGENNATTVDNTAMAAVTELLTSDLGLLFIAAGSGSPAAIRSAARPGLVLGAEIFGAEKIMALSFRIAPDENGIVEALRRILSDLPRKENADGIDDGEELVPSLLMAGPAAGLHRIDDRSFIAFLAEVESGSSRRKP
jgi:hypothetical protein